MKKKIISFIGLALFVGAVAFNVQMNSVNNDQLSDLTLKNIHAMAYTLVEVDCSNFGCFVSPDDNCRTCQNPYCNYLTGYVTMEDNGKCNAQP